MRKIVKYTVYFEYEDEYWDTADDDLSDGEGHMIYFIEEHNCHSNFINDLQRSMEENGDDICGAGETKVVEPHEVPKNISPYVINENKK